MEKTKLTEKIAKEISRLVEVIEHYEDTDLPVHEIERGILNHLLELGLCLLKYVIDQKLEKMNKYVPQVCHISKGKRNRKYLSLFGLLEITRPSYWAESCGKFYKLDEYLNLPIGSYWSYNLQELIGENASETDYEESIRIVNKLLNLGLSGKSSERNVNRLGKYVEDFYESTPLKEADESHFCVSFDGKGVPKIKPDKEKESNPKERLKRGEKKGIKQMATVSVSSSFKVRHRSADSILNGLMGVDQTEGNNKENKAKRRGYDNRMHTNIHRRAFLADQEKAVEYGIKDIKQRMTNPQSRFVVPIDAGIGLEDKVLKYIQKYDLQSQFDGIILDIVHVSEYVWEAANAIFGDQSSLRTIWVRELLKDLLESKTDKVIKDLQLNRDKTKLSKSKKAQLNKTILYFTNHKHKMDYKRYLEKGYPVSSAIVESTCGHLVKDRMEQSGMRWSSKGAQNMMDLRAVKINGDIEDFMEFVIQRDRKVTLIKSAA